MEHMEYMRNTSGIMGAVRGIHGVVAPLVLGSFSIQRWLIDHDYTQVAFSNSGSTFCR